MRPYSTLLIIAVLIFTSCKDDEVLPLTDDLVTSVKAYDLDNNGDVSDIRVDFIVQNNISVSEYRLMVVPLILSTSFNQIVAVSIPEGSFHRIIAQPFENE